MELTDFSHAFELASKSGFSIFVSDFTEEETSDFISKFPKTKTLTLFPEETKTSAGSVNRNISVESVKQFRESTNSIDKEDHYFIIVFPECMTSSQAMNCLLKTLEEPSEFHHFVFLSRTPSLILETIRSRANIFKKKEKNYLDKEINADIKIKEYAKKLITARPNDLIQLSKEIADKKSRVFALEIVSTAIDICVKSYFKTGNSSFLRLLSKLISLHKNITLNGHIRLHFVSDML